jgi:hypothetical protein
VEEGIPEDVDPGEDLASADLIEEPVSEASIREDVDDTVGGEEAPEKGSACSCSLSMIPRD